MKQRFGILAVSFLMISILFAVVAPVQAEVQVDKLNANKYFYRYKNDQGNKVIAQSIPAKFVRNGYEIVSINGEVLKVVPPAPPEEEIERIANEKKSAKEQMRHDLDLRRTYSTVAEIDAAKVRNLQELRNNIDILNANLASVKTQLKTQESHAASIERNGRKLPDDVLKNIKTLRTEELEVNKQIKQREAEYQSASDKFDQNRKRYLEITGSKDASK